MKKPYRYCESESCKAESFEFKVWIAKSRSLRGALTGLRVYQVDTQVDTRSNFRLPCANAQMLNSIAMDIPY